MIYDSQIKRAHTGISVIKKSLTFLECAKCCPPHINIFFLNLFKIKVAQNNEWNRKSWQTDSKSHYPSLVLAAWVAGGTKI